MPPRIFITYSHDSNTHVERVLSFADRLRDEGVDARLDQYLDNPPEGWTRWMQRQLEEADFVVFICSATYRTRFDGKAAPGTGQGATWEGFLATQLIYDANTLNTRFIPVYFDDSSADDIPLPLRPSTRYRLPDGYDDLYRRLTGQPKTPPPPLGVIRPMPPVTRPRLTSTSSIRGQTVQNQGSTIGQQINVSGSVTFGAFTISQSSTSQPTTTLATASPAPIKILLFTANTAAPHNMLAFENELRMITDSLQRARLRDRYDFRISRAVTFAQLVHDLDEYTPRFVHFCGSANLTGTLIPTIPDFPSATAAVEQIRQIFAAQRVRPDLIVFAACHSRDHAAAMAPYVGHAIGFAGPLQDLAAPTFSAVLYERLAASDTPDILRAFRLARLATIGSGFQDAEKACLFDYSGAVS